MLENSLTDGVLFQYRDPKTGGGKTEAILLTVKAFWTAVSTVFTDAWALPPRRSRLTHVAGVISLSFVMDAIADTLLDDSTLTAEDFVTELSRIEEVCHWTTDEWEFQDGTVRKWNDLQKTPKDIRLLANHLLGEYRARAAGKRRGSRQLRLAYRSTRLRMVAVPRD